MGFRYADSDECVLEHVSFTARPGTTLAIIGPTGSGKSTIVKLMERFYDVTEGSVTVDGIDVRDLAQADLRATFGYAPQAAFLFSGTVRSNVAYSDEAMPDERVQKALAIAQAQGGTTRIIVAQRIATIMHADHIVVLDEGRVAGQGTHDELMASCGAYREIALSQLSASELGEGGAAA